MKFLFVIILLASTNLMARRSAPGGCTIGREGQSATCQCTHEVYSLELNSQNVHKIKDFMNACKSGNEQDIRDVIRR